jgi:hypothetical protein
MAIFVFFFKKAKSRRQKHQGGTQLVKDRRPLGHVAPEHAARDLHALGGLEIKHPLRKASARGDTAHSNKQHRTNNDQGEWGSDMVILYVSGWRNAQSCERSDYCTWVPSNHDHPKTKGIKHRPSRTGLAWVHVVLLSPLEATVKADAASSLLPIKNINKSYEAAAASGASRVETPTALNLARPRATTSGSSAALRARYARKYCRAYPAPRCSTRNRAPVSANGTSLRSVIWICRLWRQKIKVRFGGKKIEKKIGKKIGKN